MEIESRQESAELDSIVTLIVWESRLFNYLSFSDHVRVMESVQIDYQVPLWESHSLLDSNYRLKLLTLKIFNVAIVLPLSRGLHDIICRVVLSTAPFIMVLNQPIHLMKSELSNTNTNKCSRNV